MIHLWYGPKLAGALMVLGSWVCAQHSAVYQTTTDTGLQLTVIGNSQQAVQAVAGVPSSQPDAGSRGTRGYSSMTSGGYHHFDVGADTSSSSRRATPTPKVKIIRPQNRNVRPPSDVTRSQNAFRGGGEAIGYDSLGDPTYVIRSSAKTRLTSKYTSLGSFGDFAEDDFDAYLARKAARKAAREQQRQQQR